MHPSDGERANDTVLLCNDTFFFLLFLGDEKHWLYAVQ